MRDQRGVWVFKNILQIGCNGLRRVETLGTVEGFVATDVLTTTLLLQRIGNGFRGRDVLRLASLGSAAQEHERVFFDALKIDLISGPIINP